MTVQDVAKMSPGELRRRESIRGSWRRRLTGDYVAPEDDVDLEWLAQAQARASTAMAALASRVRDTRTAVRDAMLATGIDPEELDAQEE